jgi:hypothetical protein
VIAPFGDSAHPDHIIFDIKPNPNGGTGNTVNGFGHATCLNNPSDAAAAGGQVDGRRASPRYSDFNAPRWDGTIPALIAALPRPVLAALVNSWGRTRCTPGDAVRFPLRRRSASPSLGHSKPR